MKHIQIVHIKVAAMPGSSIGECIREAVLVAVKEWQNIILVHNQKRYKILANDLITIATEIKDDE